MTDDSDAVQKRETVIKARVFISPKVTATAAADGGEERGQVYIAPKVTTTTPPKVTKGDNGQGAKKE